MAGWRSDIELVTDQSADGAIGFDLANVRWLLRRRVQVPRITQPSPRSA